MTHRNILQYQPWLRFVNINNISGRLLRYTKGNTFIAYNTITSQYELHSVDSFRLTGYSQNAVIEKEMLNNFLYKDYRATELKKFMNDLEDSRTLKNKLYDDHESKRKYRLANQLKEIERIIGTKI